MDETSAIAKTVSESISEIKKIADSKLNGEYKNIETQAQNSTVGLAARERLSLNAFYTSIIIDIKKIIIAKLEKYNWKIPEGIWNEINIGKPNFAYINDVQAQNNKFNMQNKNLNSVKLETVAAITSAAAGTGFKLVDAYFASQIGTGLICIAVVMGGAAVYKIFKINNINNNNISSADIYIQDIIEAQRRKNLDRINQWLNQIEQTLTNALKHAQLWKPGERETL